MKPSNIQAALALSGLLATTGAGAATLSFTGTLAQDDDVATFAFALAAPGTVTIQSFSYAGGVNGAGNPIPAGGFDLGIALFGAGGALLTSQDDATPECAGVANDPLTNDCFDVRLVTDLAAGEYLVAVVQFNNEPVGPDFAAGFSKSGADFTGVFGCSAGRFCDVSAENRTSAWAVDVTGDNLAVVPAPAAGWLLATALAGLGLCRRNWRRLPAAITVGTLGLLGATSASAVEMCNGKVATIVGTDGPNDLRGTKLPDVIVGLGGNDTITGASGNDTICGGPGNDFISAGNGHDYVDGGPGDDTIIGGFGNDYLVAGLGNDLVNGDTGIDTCDGSIGLDTAMACETARNTGLQVKKVSLPVWNGSFTPYGAAPRTTLDGSLFVPAGATRKVAVLATHGTFGGYDRGLVGWLGWWLEPQGITTLVLNRRDSTDYGGNEGGGNSLYPDAMCDLKSGVEYLVDTLGYEGVVILGHSKGTSFAPVYPGNFRSCGSDVASSPALNDPRVAGVVTVGTIADNREGATAAPFAGPSLEEEVFPGLNCGPLLYPCALAQAQAEIDAGRGDTPYDFLAGVTLGNGGLLSASVQLTPRNVISYYGPDTLAVVEREAQKLTTPYLIVHAEGDTATPVQWSDRLYATLLQAGKDVTYFQPPYASLYPNGGPRDPNRGLPAHSMDAEGARWDFAQALADWIAGVIPGAGDPATGVNYGAIAALPDFDPVLVPPAPNPALP